MPTTKHDDLVNSDVHILTSACRHRLWHPVRRLQASLRDTNESADHAGLLAMLLGFQLPAKTTASGWRGRNRSACTKLLGASVAAAGVNAYPRGLVVWPSQRSLINQPSIAASLALSSPQWFPSQPTSLQMHRSAFDATTPGLRRNERHRLGRRTGRETVDQRLVYFSEMIRVMTSTM